MTTADSPIQDPRTELLYVANMHGGNISVIDLARAKFVDTVEMERVTVDGRDLAMQVDSLWASPDSRFVYMSRYPAPVGRSRGEDRLRGDFAVLDTERNEIAWTVELPGQPNHICASPDGRHVYVPIRDRNFIEVIDTTEQRAVGRVPCGWGPHGTEISADGGHVYVGTIWQHTLSVIDTATLECTHKIPMGESVRPFVISADEGTAYVQLSRLHGFKVVDLERRAVSATVHLPPLDPGIALPQKVGYTVNHGMRMLSDGSTLYAAASIANYLAVYSLPDLRLRSQIPTGTEPAFVQLSRDEELLCIPNRLDDTVSLFSVADETEVARIDVGDYPNRMTTIVR